MQLKPKLDKLKKRYRKSTKPQKLLTWIVAALCLGMSAYGIAWLLDMKKFRDIESTNTRISGSFIEGLGTNVNSYEQRNLCHKRGASPFDNGRLWCQAATVITLNRDYTYPEIGDIFSTSVSGHGDITSDDKLLPRISIKTNKGIDCDLRYRPEQRSYGYIVFDVATTRETNVAIISCAAPALQSHYQTYEEYELSH